MLLAVLLSSGERFEEYLKWYCGVLLFAFFWTATGHDFFGIDTYYLFYSFFWIFGLISHLFSVKGKKQLACVLCIVFIGYLLSVYLTRIPCDNLQQAKFPPQLPYFFASTLLVVFTMYFEQYLKIHVRYLVHVGQNAFFYYIAQGIGSSLLYYILPKIHTRFWFIKWGTAFIANLLVTAVVAELFAVSYGCCCQYYKRICLLVKIRK